MGTRERRQREKENLRRAILDAARELFLTEGYDAVSMRKIAAAIEYTPTSIYLYFQDKEAILTALCDEGFAILGEQLYQHRSIEDPIARLRRGASAYYAFAQSNAAYYNIMFEMKKNPLALDPKYGYEESDSPPYKAFAFIKDAVSEAMASGQVPAQVVDTIRAKARIPGTTGLGAGQLICAHAPEAILAHVIWASMHGMVSLLLSGRLGMLPEEAHPFALEAATENMLRGLVCAQT